MCLKSDIQFLTVLSICGELNWFFLCKRMTILEIIYTSSWVESYDIAEMQFQNKRWEKPVDTSSAPIVEFFL